MCCDAKVTLSGPAYVGYLYQVFSYCDGTPGDFRPPVPAFLMRRMVETFIKSCRKIQRNEPIAQVNRR